MKNNRELQYVKGDLIKLALQKKFDVITHGCNCFCRMGSGIAVPMKNHFGCDMFPLEKQEYRCDYNKLGQIDYKPFKLDNTTMEETEFVDASGKSHTLWVVNSYTQYAPGQPTEPYGVPLDYDALKMCFRKINRKFSGSHLGIPKIGSGLAGGNWNRIETIIKNETPNMNVTVVEYEK